MKVALDSSAIILLAKADILRQACSIANLETTEEVKAEVMQGLKKSKKDALYLQELAKEGKIKIVKIESRLAEKFKKDFNLGPGEASIIALSIKQKIPMTTDDNKARKIGKILGLQVLPSLNFPVILYRKKKISYEKAKAALSVMEREGWFGEDVIREAFNNLKEETR